MSLRFILGRAGTGKTYKCLQEIREELFRKPDGKPLILLVPEQATFQIEKELASTPGLGGAMRAQVMSFRRLAYRILLEVGGAARPHIGDLGKRMILRNIIEQRKSTLKVFARAAKQPGFSDSLATVLSEMKMYGIEPSVLETTLAGLHSSEPRETEQLTGKLQDILVLYKDLEDFLYGRYTDPDDYLQLLARDISKAHSITGAQVWVDGFSGFTPQEYKVLENLLHSAAQVNIALCLDTATLPHKTRTEDLFYSTKQTYQKLIEIAKEHLIEVEESCCTDKALPDRFLSAPAIAHLEQNYFRRPAPLCEKAEEISIVAAANPRVEIEAVAREITRLCRDENYRLRDISVILRDTSQYAPYIQTIFTDHNIPFFIDQKQPVIHHPLVELVRSALEVVESNWGYEAVFRFFKTDFAPISRDKVDLLENYVLVHGIRGQRWYDGKDWLYRRQYTIGENFQMGDWEKDYLEKINRAKEQGTVALIKFYKALKTKEDLNVKGICEALFMLLEDLQVSEQLQGMSSTTANEGLLKKAREHAQVWNDFVYLIDEIVEALGEARLTLTEFVQVINTGLEGIRMGLIPPALDQVLVASLERSRNPNIRAAFVVGVNDGVLPQRKSENGLLNDAERLYLSKAGLELAPDSKRKILDEQFLIYIALTRASERLWLSYALADSEGGALMPSMVIARIKEICPNIKEITFPVEPSFEEGEEYITHQGRALTYLATQLRHYKHSLLQGKKADIDPLWWDIYNHSLNAPELKERLALYIAGLFHSNSEKSIDKITSKKLYGSIIQGSVSRLEKFAACPFQHFASHGLKLKERAFFKLAAPDLGQFFHAALKRVDDLIVEEKLDWAAVTKERCTELSERAVSEIAPQLQNEILLSTARLRYLTRKLRRTVERSVRTLAEHAKRGQFRPVGLEIGFGKGGELPPLQIELPNGTVLEMGGRIDRIDKAQFGDASYLRIIDFKSGSSKLKLLEICMGTKLQLLTYLDVALTNAEKLLGNEAKPAGILYFPVTDPMLTTDGKLTEEEIEEKILRKMKTHGLVLRDKDVVGLMDSEISKYSFLIPVGMNQDGGFYANSAVLTEEQFEQLRIYLRHLLMQYGERIAEGEVKIDPYQMQQFRVCQYCAYKAVCQFDTLLTDNSYRIIDDLEENEIWQLIGSALEGGGSNE